VLFTLADVQDGPGYKLTSAKIICSIWLNAGPTVYVSETTYTLYALYGQATLCPYNAHDHVLHTLILLLYTKCGYGTNTSCHCCCFFFERLSAWNANTDEMSL